MTVGELRQALNGVSNEATVHVSVTFSWDGKSGGAVGAVADDCEADGAPLVENSEGLLIVDPARASDFSIIGEDSCWEILTAAWQITGIDLRPLIDNPYETWPPREPDECDHKWRDYSEYGGDFLKTPVVCKHCGQQAPPDVTESILEEERLYRDRGKMPPLDLLPPRK